MRRPNEAFLRSGESPAEEPPQTDLSQEEVLRQPVHIPHRPLKDPRKIRLLDPACGSMHFGLYAFDLFTVIYDEAWEIAHGPDDAVKSAESFAPFVAFAASFPDKAAFVRKVPCLIVERNIHGIDIDPRAVQIAGLSLWLRAQRVWHQAGVEPADRPRIIRANLVCAEPMPGEKDLLREFVEQQFPAGERPAFAFLLETVFDRMVLAGEAGSLLRIEEEIRIAIADAKRLWKQGPRHEQALLFSAPDEKGGQGGWLLDLSGITDGQFWERAEQRIYDALEAYAEQAANGGGFQRRLFADDAARGFAFIDLCRKRYDVVVMNPPFGDATPATLALVRRDCPEYAENLYVAFHSRAQELLSTDSFTGIISSRTFVAYRDFEKFRDNLLERSTICAFADLGWEVLDTAQVETAAYITVNAQHLTAYCGPFFRLLAVPPNEKEKRLLAAVEWTDTARTFFAKPTLFKQLPGSPLCYWSSAKFVEEISKAQTLYPLLAFVGLGASPHAFFFRAWWEVPMHRLGKRWKRICRGGDYSPFYRANVLVIDWLFDGASVKLYICQKYPYLNGNFGWKIQDEGKYGMSGLTWGKRNERFNVQAMPAGHIFTDEGQGIVPEEATNALFLLGYMNSALAAYFLNLTSGLQKHYVYIRPVPVLTLSDAAREVIERSTEYILGVKRAWDTTWEISPLYIFALPRETQVNSTLGESYSEASQRWRRDAQSIQRARDAIDEAMFSEMALGDEDAREVRSLRATFPTDAPNIEGFIPVEGDEKRLAMDLLSYGLGCALGRWDVRYATGEWPVPELPDPFAPLPVCPPGMLQGDDGLPLSSEAGRRLRAEGRYPLDVAWDGILVDDPEHPLALERRVHDVLAVLWGDRVDALEHEACAFLGVPTLREWFRRPAGFFADHLKRYSKSRRKAPIYLPLSTASGSYTIWVYYHRLTADTLFQLVAEFLDPKLRKTAEARLQAEAGQGKAQGREAAKLVKQAGELLELELELEEMKDELLRVASLPYKPDLDDGVQITAAPLWRLFRLPAWRKVLEDTWKKLERGHYDWAHLAYAIWPDRVREKCKTDRSLAIAHGLEDLCEVQVAPKKARGRRGRE